MRSELLGIIVKRMISISNECAVKFEDQCLIPQLKLSHQGMIITGYQREIKLIRRSE